MTLLYKIIEAEWEKLAPFCFFCTSNGTTGSYFL